MADTSFEGVLIGSGLNAIVAIGYEETYNAGTANERWSSLVDEVSITREDTVYEGRGISNVRTMNAQTTVASKYPVSIRGKMDSAYPLYAMGVSAATQAATTMSNSETAGDAVLIEVAATTGFTAGEYAWISDTTSSELCYITSIDDGVSITVANMANNHDASTSIEEARQITVFRGASHTTPTKTFLNAFEIRRTFDEGTDDSLCIKGFTFDTGTFSCDLDAPWNFDLSGVGKSQGTTAATGASIPTTMLGSWNTLSHIDVDATDFVEDTNERPINGLRNVSFTINNNLNVRSEFGTSAPASIRQPKYGVANIELRLTRGYIDDDLWTQIADGGSNSFRFETTNGTASILNEFDDCRASSTEHPVNLDDETIETVTLICKDWKAYVGGDGVTYDAHY